MSKKLLINSVIDNETIILCENYSPNKQPFYLWQDKIINWDNYELYMNIDILADYTKNAWGNVLSMGQDIHIWHNTKAKWHVYYNGETKKLRFQCNLSTFHAFDISLNELSKVEIIINKNGAYLNGELKLHNNLVIQGINNVFTTSPISIGSQEGAFKGIAQYNLVCLRKYKERG